MPVGWRFVHVGADLSIDTSRDDDAFDDGWASGGDALPMGPVPLLEFVESGHTVDFAPGMSEGFAYELVEAAARGDVTLLQRILASKLAKGGADAISAGRSALYAAVEQDQMVTAEVLIERGAVVESSTICCALAAGFDRCSRLLAAVRQHKGKAQLDGMVQVVAPGEGAGRQYSPLGLACAAGDTSSASLLLGATADPNELADGVRRRTALHIAAGVGSVGCVQALLKAGARTTLAVVTGHGLKPGDAPAEPCLRLNAASPPHLDRAAALGLLKLESRPAQSSTVNEREPQPEAGPLSVYEPPESVARETDPRKSVAATSIHEETEQSISEAQIAADMAAAALLQEVADEERRNQQRKDKKRSKKKRAKLRRQIDSDTAETSSSSCAGSQADANVVADACVDTVNIATPASNKCAHETCSGVQESASAEVSELEASASELAVLRQSLAAAEARASAHEKECQLLKQQLEHVQRGTSPERSSTGGKELEIAGGIGLPGTPPRRPALHPRVDDMSSISPGLTSSSASCSSAKTMRSVSDDASSDVESGFTSGSIEAHSLEGELEIAQAIIRAQCQVMEEADLRYHVASFGSVAPGGSTRLGINFGKDGSTWPVVAEITPGSLADSVRPSLLGSRLHSIAGKDGRGIHVSGLSLEDGLAMVRAIGRPLLLTFERAVQSASTGYPSASVSVKESDGERCPSPELLESEGAVHSAESYQRVVCQHEPGGEQQQLDPDEETEEEDYQDAEEHPVLPYTAVRSDDIDDGADGGAGEAYERNTVLGETVREIRVLLNSWLQNVASTIRSHDGKNTERDTAAPIAHVYVYGSCLLFGDIVEDDSDIDLLVVAPSIVNRQTHFFGPQPEPPPIPVETVSRVDRAANNTLETENAGEQLLHRNASRDPSVDMSVLAQLLATDLRVSELAAVRESYVPCLRFKFNGRAIDLTLATPGLKSPLPGEAAQLRGCGWSSDLPAGLMNEAVLQSLRSVMICVHFAFDNPF